MTQRTYDSITLACLLTAIASAVAFQHGEAYQVLAGILGILSALLAAVTYYVYHVRSATRSDGKKVSEAKDNPEVASEVPAAAGELHEMFAALTRDLPSPPAKSVGKSALFRMELERELLRDTEFLRDFEWEMQVRLGLPHEAGREARRVYRSVAMLTKPHKRIAPADKPAVHKGWPKSQGLGMWSGDICDMEPSGSWSESSHRAVA